MMDLESERTFVDPSAGMKRIAFPSLLETPSIELTVVVPAYNEAVRLPPMLDETIAYLSRRSAAEPNFSWEIIIVDDGSSDSTVDTAMKYVKKYTADRVRVLKMARNRGKGGAVRAGAMVARGKWVLMADADAATVFAEIEKLEAVAATGNPRCDVVVGSRVHLRKKSDTAERRNPLRAFVSWVFHLVVVFVGGVKGIKDTQCGFKLFSRKAACIAFSGQRLERWAFDVELLYRCQAAGLVIKEVDVQWAEVPGSKLSVIKATINMLKDMLRMRVQYALGNWQLSTPLQISNSIQ